MGVGDAVDFQNLIGKERIETRVRALAQRLKKQLQEIDGVKLYTSTQPELCAAMTTFSVKNYRCEEIQAKLRQKYHLEARPVPDARLNAIRLSTHIYNSLSDVDAAIAAIAEIAREGV